MRTDNNLLATTLHVRRDNDRYLNIAGRLGRSSGATATNLSSLNTRSDRDLNVQGRYRAWGWFIDASFDDGRSNSRWPERASVPDPAQPGGYLTHGGYVARSDARLIQTTLTRNFGGNAGLDGGLARDVHPRAGLQHAPHHDVADIGRLHAPPHDLAHFCLRDLRIGDDVWQWAVIANGASQHEIDIVLDAGTHYS